MQLKTLTTKLETSDRESIDFILNNKVEQRGAAGVTDYIGLALDNLSSQKDRIKQAVNELREVQKSIEYQEEVIKAGVAEWLESNGIDRLEGDRISSITVFNKKETTELMIDNEEAVINAGYFKTEIDKTATKNALIEGVQIEGAHLTITHNETSIKLNKKRLKANEVEDAKSA